MDFIPLQTGQAALLQGQPLINDLLGEVGYEVRGNTVYFDKDITVQNVNFVDMQLVVLDIDRYDEFTTLPLPKDMESIIIEEVYKQFAPATLTPDLPLAPKNQSQ